MVSITRLCNKGLLLNEGVMKTHGGLAKVINAYNSLLEIHFSGKDMLSNRILGNDNFQIKAISLDKTDTLYTRDSVPFTLSFINKMDNINSLDITIHFTDESGNKIFVAGTNPDKVIIDPSPGEKTIKIEIPKGILHYGTYSIERLIFLINKSTGAYEASDVLRFHINPKIEPQFGWSGPKEGIVRPELNWEIIKQ